MGKSGKLFATLVNGVKALKSPSTREKSTKENAHARKERDSLVSKQRCMWSLGKSSSRNKGSVGVSPHPGFEVKDVQVQQLSQGSQHPASSFHYTDASLDEITSTLADEIVQEEPPPHESCQEDWATILKLSDDESEPEQYLAHNPQPEQYLGHDPQPEEQAAVRIQAAIRRYLVKQKLKRTLETVIRLQAVARGRMVRKQAATTLRCIHALVKFQANARGWLVRTSEVGRRVRQHLEEIRLQDPMLLEEEFQCKKQNHSQHIAFALDEQLCRYPSKPSQLPMDFEPDKDHWGWAWLDRWMAARPWEISSSPVLKEKPKITAPDRETESDNMVDEGAESIVSNVEKQNESASIIQMDISIPSASLSTLHEVPLPPPPPPPPLPSFIKAAHPSMEHPVLCATEASSESASLCAAPTTIVTTGEFSDCASLCAAPTPMTIVMTGEFSESASLIAANPGTANISIESARFNEENSDSSTSADSEVSLPAKEPQEIMLLATPVELGALQTQFANPSVDEASPPASSFLQQNEPTSSSGLTKEEDWRQHSPSAPMHVADSQQEDEIDSAEPGVSKASILRDAPVRPIDEEKTAMEMDITSEVSKHDDKSPSGTRDNSVLSNAEAGNIRAEAEETVKITKGDLVKGSNYMKEGSLQVKGNGFHDASVTPIMLSEAENITEGADETVKIIKGNSVKGSNDMKEVSVQVKRNGLRDASGTPIMLSEGSAKQMGSILVKHEQGEGVSQSLPSYMATTKSSKAKARSQASPKPMPESPKQRLMSPRHSSGSKKTPASEGKDSFANSRQIMHIRAGSKGQLASIIKDGSTDSSLRSLGDSKRHSK